MRCEVEGREEVPEVSLHRFVVRVQGVSVLGLAADLQSATLGQEWLEDLVTQGHEANHDSIPWLVGRYHLDFPILTTRSLPRSFLKSYAACRGV